MEETKVNSNIQELTSGSSEFIVKDLDTGMKFDLRKRQDYSRLDKQILAPGENQGLDYYLENLKIQEKISTEFFKACESGDLNKISLIIDPKKSPDRKPNINEKYLHNFTVLHIAISNCNFIMILSRS